MSAPDVERLKSALIRSNYHGCLCGCRPVFDEPHAENCEIQQTLAALSSHQAPLPASADIAGRLADSLAEAIGWIVAGCKADKGNQVKWQKWSDSLRAYRATPTGWIPVGERLPDDSGSIVLAWDRIHARPFILAAWELAHQTRFTLWQPMPTPPQEGQKP